jgi:muconolactone delta-isomerase
MKYLVSGSDGPGFATPEEALQLLEKVVVPSLDAMNKLQAEKRILAGGLKVGERAFVFVAEAESNEKLDRMLREIPFWGMVRWEVTPLEGFDTRAAEERVMMTRLKGAKKK